MKKKNIYLAIASLLTLTGCGGGNKVSSEESKKPQTGDCLINDFETDADIAMLRFPRPLHENRGKFELSDQHVTHGSKSVKFSNIYNTSFEMENFFSHCATKDIDVSDIKSIEMDIYNDSAFDTEASVIIYGNSSLDILLQEKFALPKQEMTHINFALSKIALEYNYKSVISSSLILYTPNTDYQRFVGYTFYIDNWKATMGGEYTGDDLVYQPKITSVRDKIDALPRGEAVSIADEEAFKSIAEEYAALPDLYRRIVPNYSVYKEKLEAFKDLKIASLPISQERNQYIFGNQFFGSAQLTPTTATAAEVFYDPSVKGRPGDEGATKILFNGTIHSQFTYSSPISKNGYDDVHFVMKNETGRRTRVWLDYANMVYFDLPKDEVYEFSMGANRFGIQTFWTFDQLSDAMDGTVLPGTGAIYLIDIYFTGRSEEVRKAQLDEAFSRLPDPETLVNGDDIIPYLSVIETARARYDEATKELKQMVSNALYNRLLALEYKATTTGYGVAFSASKQGYIKYYYGDDFNIERGILDDDYGYVQKLHLTNCRNAGGVPEQAIGFDTDVVGSYAGYRLAIFNPTSAPVLLTSRNTNWNWERYEQYFTNATLLPGAWTVVDIKADLLRISTDGKAALFLHSEENVSLKGEWLFTSLYGLPYAV